MYGQHALPAKKEEELFLVAAQHDARMCPDATNVNGDAYQKS